MADRLIYADKLIELINDDIASLNRDMSREGYDVCLCTLQMVKQYIKALQKDAQIGEDKSHPFAESVIMGMDGGENESSR